MQIYALIALCALGFVAHGSPPKRGSLSGRCVIAPQAGTSFEEPCSSMVLKLIDANGSVISRTRCTTGGEFVFSTPLEGKFFIHPESESFALESKRKPLANGDWMDIRLKRL